MLVLVTGAFGNVGAAAVRELHGRGHRVRAFDLETRTSRRRAEQCDPAVEVLWGDLRDEAAVRRATEGVDAVAHLAFVLPPSSERLPEAAEAVNVGGSRSLVEALEASDAPAKLVLASSYTVYGDTRGAEGLLTSESTLRPVSVYARHKVTVEQMVRESALSWCVLRLGVVLSAETVLGGRIDPVLFDLPVDGKQEFVHTDDVALAIARCLESDDVGGRTLLVGGGESCQLRYLDLINRQLEVMGIGPLPAEAFSRAERQGGGWMDTSESQRLLRYQRWSFDKHLEDVARKAGWRRGAARLLAPLIRWHMVRQSPHRKEGGSP